VHYAIRNSVFWTTLAAGSHPRLRRDPCASSSRIQPVFEALDGPPGRLENIHVTQDVIDADEGRYPE
jgi:hypothetical protein